MIKYEKNNKITFKLEGYEVTFPYEPYKCQKDIITNILKGIKNNKNSIIESPTGTGKCMSALSTIIANFKKNCKNSNYIEEKKTKEKIVKALMLLEEFHPKIQKIFKNWAKPNKRHSIAKIIDYFDEIIKGTKSDNYSSEDSNLNLLEILMKHELMLEYCNLLDKMIANYIISNFKIDSKNSNENNDSHDKINILAQKLNIFYDKILIAYHKLRDSLKRMKFSHSVIYAVRTSSQIDIVNEEFNKLNENYNIAYLKSREFFCINSDLDEFKGNTKNKICGKLVKKSICESHKNFKTKQNKTEKQESQSNLKSSYGFDFDSKLSRYKSNNICPYYSEKENAKYADIIVCTYNYLFTKSSKDTWIDYVVNPIVVIDEAHNVVAACEDHLNFKINLKNISVIIDRLLIFYDHLIHNNKSNSLNSSYLQENSNTNNQDELQVGNFIIQSQKSISFLFMVCYNLLSLNEDDIKQYESFPNLNTRKETFEYVGINILEIFCFLFNIDNIDKSLQIQHEEFNYMNETDSFSNDDDLEENQVKKIDSQQVNRLHEKLKSTMINIDNYIDQVNSLFAINEKHIDIFKKEIQELDKLANFLYFLFETLINNFSLVYTTSNRKSNIQQSNFKRKLFIDDYYLVTNSITNKKLSYLGNNSSSYVCNKNKILIEFKELMEELKEDFNELDNPHYHKSDLKYYQIIHEKLKEISEKFDFEKKYINLICMNPGISFKMFKNIFHPSSIIFLSGTLNPFDYYSEQLITEFHYQLQNTHIIDKSNLNFFVFTESIFNEKNFNLSFTKENFENLGMNLLIESLKIISDFSQNSGRGNLIFFKTYSMLNEFIKILIKNYEINSCDYSSNSVHDKTKNYFKIIRKPFCIEIFIKKKIYKRFFIDSNVIDSKVKETILNSYKKSCSEGIKSYLLTVMRGLFSEGVNFDKEESSMIFILGIPFPDLTDDYVRLKRCYLTKKFQIRESPFNGDEWYSIQAMTALNQTLGRSIRRKNDFSTVCVLESNLLKRNIFKLLSNWIKEVNCNIVERNNYAIYKAQNKEFYKKFLENFEEVMEIESELENNQINGKRINDRDNFVKVKIDSNIPVKGIDSKIMNMNNGFFKFSYK